MNYGMPGRGPLIAFLVTLAVVMGYIIVLHRWLLTPGSSNELGQFLNIGVPFVLSAVVYVAFVRDESASKQATRLRVLAATVLAPAITWTVYVLVGFVFFDWRM